MLSIPFSLSVFDSIRSVIEKFSDLFVKQSVPNDLFLGVSIAILVIYCIGIFIISSLSYENRVLQMLGEMNKWFYKHPTLNADNLKEFNNKMKAVPKPIRVRWQTYVLFRDKKPSEYLTFADCIERPMQYSSFYKSIKNINLIFYVLFTLIMVINVAGVFGSVASIGEVPGNYIEYIIIIPVIVLLLKWFFTMIMNLRMNSIITDIYTDFAIFLRALDKASYNLPEYIDYEMLFTSKEINTSIPILQDYIEQRDIKEKEELEKAQQSEIDQDKFDFSAVNNNASLLLERALKECNFFLNNKTRLTTKINQKKDEIDALQKNYQNNLNDYEKQLQLSRENIQRLKYNLETSTSRVETNRIKKQQDEELKRQEEIEKNINDQEQRFNTEVDKIKKEMEVFENELADKKRYIENVMMSEFRSYSEKIYDDINNQNKEQYDKEKEDLEEDNDILQEEIRNMIIQLKNAGIQTSPSVRYLAKQEKKRLKEAEEKQKQEQENEKRMLEAKEVTEKANAALKGNEVEIEDADGNKVKVSAFTDSKEDGKQEGNEEVIVYDENGAYFDKDGNYIYQDGTYYDKEGNYHDAQGKLILPGEQQNAIEYDENGAYYDAQGNYVYKDGSYYDTNGRFHDAQGNVVEEKENNKENIEYDENGAYYDDQGYYRYRDGSYYDPLGNYYDAQGNLVAPAGDNDQ